MPFGIVGRTGSGMRQVVGFGDRSREGYFPGAHLGRAIVTNGHLLSQRRGPLPKLLWTDLLLIDHSCDRLMEDRATTYYIEEALLTKIR